MTTQSVPLDSIRIDDRLRRVDPEEAERLAHSMADIGQLQPIVVVERGAADKEVPTYQLVAGAHRVAAARALKWVDIQATVVFGTDDKVRLLEIDENLYRHELTPFDQAAFLAERRDVCQRLGMIAKGRGRPGKGANLALFQDELAEKFGIGRRTMFRALRRHELIHRAVWARLSGTKLAQQGAALDALAAVPPDKQMGVVERWFTSEDDEPNRGSFSALCRQAMGGRAEKTSGSRKRRQTLKAAWLAADHTDVTWLLSELPIASLYHLSREVEEAISGLRGHPELPE